MAELMDEPVLLFEQLLHLHCSIHNSLLKVLVETGEFLLRRIQLSVLRSDIISVPLQGLLGLLSLCDIPQYGHEACDCAVARSSL